MQDAKIPYRCLTQYPRYFFLIVLSLTIIMALGIRKLQVDAEAYKLLGLTSEKTISKKLPSAEAFHAMNFVLVHDDRLFSREKLQILHQLQIEIEHLSGVSKVTSLFNTADVQYYLKNNSWQPILEERKIASTSMAQLKKDALSNPLLIHQLINTDATSIAFIVQFDENMADKNLLESRNNLEDILQSQKNNVEALFQFGPTDVLYYTVHDATHDIAVTAVLALIVLIVAFSWFFRTAFLGLAPFLTAGLAMLWTLGLMGYLHIHVNAMTTLAVIMVYTISTMENAHFINAYQKSMHANPSAPASQHIRSMYQAVLFPLLLTSLSAVMGFASNLLTNIEVLRNFSMTICLAIIMNALLLCSLTPNLLLFVKIKKNKNIEFYYIKKKALSIYQYVIKFPFLIYGILLSTIIMSFVVLDKIPIETLIQSYYYKHSDLLMKMKAIEKYMGGVERMIVNMQMNDQTSMGRQEILQALLMAEQEVRQLTETSSTMSPASIEASIYHLLREDSEEERYHIPRMKLYSNFLFDQLQSFDDMRFLISEDNTAARLVVMYHVDSSKQSFDYMNKVHRILQDHLKAYPIDFEIEGVSQQYGQAIAQLLKAQLIGIGSIYFSIFVIMLIIFRSVKAGLISIVPNIFPLSVIILFLYVFNIPFMVTSVIVLTAVLGMAVDDTLHILYYFKKNFLKCKHREEAIIQTIEMLVRPVTITTLTLMLGMSMFFFSLIKANMQYGLLMIVGSASAWLANLTITPFLLHKIDVTKRLRPGGKSEKGI